MEDLLLIPTISKSKRYLCWRCCRLPQRMYNTSRRLRLAPLKRDSSTNEFQFYCVTAIRVSLPPRYHLWFRNGISLSGHEIFLGLRDLNSNDAKALEKFSPKISSHTIEEAISNSEVILFSTPPEAAISVAKQIASQLSKEAGFSECYDFGGDDKVELLEQFAFSWINLAIIQKHGRNIAFKVLKR